MLDGDFEWLGGAEGGKDFGALVQAGDQVVVQGQNTLKDGQSIVVPGASEGGGNRGAGAQSPNR